MNLLHLRYFVELAHTRHFTCAAEQMKEWALCSEWPGARA